MGSGFHIMQMNIPWRVKLKGKKKKLSVKDIITIQWEENVDAFQINPSFAHIPWDDWLALGTAVLMRMVRKLGRHAALSSQNPLAATSMSHSVTFWPPGVIASSCPFDLNPISEKDCINRVLWGNLYPSTPGALLFWDSSIWAGDRQRSMQERKPGTFHRGGLLKEFHGEQGDLVMSPALAGSGDRPIRGHEPQ